jgi:hypothetical protein
VLRPHGLRLHSKSARSSGHWGSLYSQGLEKRSPTGIQEWSNPHSSLVYRYRYPLSFATSLWRLQCPGLPCLSVSVFLLCLTDPATPMKKEPAGSRKSPKSATKANIPSSRQAEVGGGRASDNLYLCNSLTTHTNPDKV